MLCILFHPHHLHPSPSPHRLCASASPDPQITLRLRGRREGHPVYRDHWSNKDWLRRDSLMKKKSVRLPLDGGATACGNGREWGSCPILFRRTRVGNTGGEYYEGKATYKDNALCQRFF